MDITARPQPAFEVIKRHYCHGLLGRALDGSIVELECLAQLPRSFPRILAAGVTEDQLLLHLYFTYEYVFKVLDTAPLPGGKTYKIVDLGDLSLPDLRSEGFRFISKVGGKHGIVLRGISRDSTEISLTTQAGALLAVNFPQRLHKAFLVNVPSWW